MELLGWLGEPPVSVEELSEPSPPPAFLSLRRTKPAKKGATSTHLLTPFESHMKDMIIRLYSDQGNSQGNDNIVSETSLPVAYSERDSIESETFVEQLDYIQEDTDSGNNTSNPQVVAQPAKIPVHILRAETEQDSSFYPRPKSSSSLNSGLFESEGLPLDCDLSKMADTGTTTPLSSTSEGLPVLSLFSASDREVDFSDSLMPPSVPPVGGLPYTLPRGIPDKSRDGGEQNRPSALRNLVPSAPKEFSSSLGGNPASSFTSPLPFLHSLPDSAFSPNTPQSVLGSSKPRSQVTESFGIQPHMLPSTLPHSKPPHFSPVTSMPHALDAGSNKTTGNTIQASTTKGDSPKASNLTSLVHSTPPGVSQPALPMTVSDTQGSTGSHTTRVPQSPVSNPNPSPRLTSKQPFLPKSPGSYIESQTEEIRPGVRKEAVLNQKPEEDAFHLFTQKPELDITGSFTGHTDGFSSHALPLTTEEPPTQVVVPHDLQSHEEAHSMSKLEDIETASTVSVQQLLESLQPSEPPDFQSTADNAGSGTFPLPAPSQSRDQLDSDRAPTPTGNVHRSFPTTPASPSKYLTPTKYGPTYQQQKRYAELPTSAKMPSHIQPSPKPEKTSPFSPLPRHGSAESSGHFQAPPFNTIPLSSETFATTHVKPTESTHDDFDSLEQQLTEALQAKANLEGQLESIVEECKATLKDRAELQSKLARAEAELATAMEKERNRPKPKLIEGPLDMGREIEHLRADLKEARSALEQEQRAAAALKNEVAKERQQARKLQNDLAETQESLKEQEAVTGDLKEKLGLLQANADQQGGENLELGYKLSSLQASYEALEGTKAWLHDQLQDALKTNLKQQEELRESKATAIAQSIKMDQLMKENTAFQQQIGDLQKGVLQDKARLVSELEVIEADALSREDLCAQLVAERAQMEDLVRMKGDDLEKLGSDLARIQVERDELQQELDKTNEENETLVQQARRLEREKKSLKDKLLSTEQQLDAQSSDLGELEKLKSTLQQRLKESEAALVGKEGTIQGLKDAKDILKHELEMVKQTRDTAERELNDAKKEIAELEADLKTALDANQEKDVRVKGMIQAQQASVAEKELMQAQLLNTEKELAQKSGELSSLESQSQDLMTQFKSLEDQFQSIAAESGSKHDNVAEKDRVISQLAAEKERMQHEVGSVKAENEHLQNKLAQLQQKAARMEGELEATSTNSLEEFQKALRDKAQLQSDLNSLKLGHQEEMMKAQAKIGRIESDLKAVKKEAARAEREWQKALVAQDEKLREVAEAQSQAESLLEEANNELEHAISEKEAVEGMLKACEDQIQKLKARNGDLAKQNQELVGQLQEEAAQKSDIERASSMVAMNLKQNAEERERKLQEELRELSLEVERLRGRLAGINTTQVAIRDHAGVLETTLAKRESSLVKLSAQAQKVLEEKGREDQEFRDQISSLEQQLVESQRELEGLREEVLDEKKRAGELEHELLQRDSELATLRLKFAKSGQDLPTLESKLAKLSQTKEQLQQELGDLKSQLVVARMSVESAQRDLSDRNSQIEILQQELKVAILQGRQAGEEVRQLQEQLRVAEERHTVEVESLKRALSEVTVAARESSAVDAGGLGPPPFDASLSSIGVDETDKPMAQLSTLGLFLCI